MKKNNLSPRVQPELTNWLVWDVKIQKNFLAPFARQKLLTIFNCIYCLRVMLKSTFRLLLHWYDHCLIYYILYIDPYFTIKMTNYHDLTALNNMWVMFTQAYQINLSVKLAREPKQSVKLPMKLSGCSSCSVKLSQKPELGVNLLQKPCESLN